ncbi:type VI secretion system ATPase TssH [Noviherbaspirillum saxi]|uniref:Type VI secretion system ATPase TssH n=1 Tax=Noviherbaspirillum saxi TaxID=2320863 RepID=A0A3A3FMZ7_9BURK|nr:type VI secretion system ATPase TssH [Noviherbaspirillum saxi]RJF95845.1 type VI secretion system ATPase TssH [Noviherbaspirillum saxi]
MPTNLKVLIGKLNGHCKKAAEQAISLCVSRGHYEVELEHLFLALLGDRQSDLFLLSLHDGVDPELLERGLLSEVARLKTGNTRTPVFSAQLPLLLEHAWLLASLESNAGSIRSGHLLIALLTEPTLAQLAPRMSPLFQDYRIDDLKHKFDDICAAYPESIQAAPQTAIDTMRPAATSRSHGENAIVATSTPALDQFTDNLTRRAREGKIDPVIGRDAQIRLVVDILMRRRQNNPILTGEAGVGKTAVVEGFAQRLADGDVPEPLKGVELHMLDIGLLQAGASVKGEFENRLRTVIQEVKQSPHPIILFIDEAHTIVGAGGQAGQNDAANLLKPALARGELRTIAATTWSEYKKYFEKDAALARRFQVVKVEEPSEQIACMMLRGLAVKMEKHFNVRVLDEAIADAVRLSSRYISERQLPDKAISVLDTACAKLALAQAATPAAIEDARNTGLALTQEIVGLERELTTGAAHEARLAELQAQYETNRGKLVSLETRWEIERKLVEKANALRSVLEQAEPQERVLSVTAEIQAAPCGGRVARRDGINENDAALKEFLRTQKELALLQGNDPLIPACVDGQAVASVISSWTGIPLGRMFRNEIEAVLKLQALLEQRVIGQSHALQQVSQRMRTARANIEDPNKPKGVFLFVGPSGVGKTETAFALAEALYGGQRNLLTINMSEYQEAHSVSGLKGSPPGYVGYGEGGVLTEAVRRKPYCVVLLDEIEKAHPDVLELFFQVFDKGVLDDAEGREVDFRNTVIILTSNVATQAIMQACLNKNDDERPAPAMLEQLVQPSLYKVFKPAFLGRTKIIPYYPLPDSVLVQIIRMKLDQIAERLAHNHRISFTYAEDAVNAILDRCVEADSGARNIDHVLNGTVLPELAEIVLSRIAEGKSARSIRVSMSKSGKFSYKAG